MMIMEEPEITLFMLKNFLGKFYDRAMFCVVVEIKLLGYHNVDLYFLVFVESQTICCKNFYRNVT